MAEKPYRLMLPSPDARVARSVFEDGLAVADATPQIVLVPIVQWSSIRIRGRIDGDTGTIGVQFCRPARNEEPGGTFGEAFVYGADQPAINATAWVDDTEFSLEITATEHQGENWLKITLTGDGNAPYVVDFLDVSGVLLGLYH